MSSDIRDLLERLEDRIDKRFDKVDDKMEKLSDMSVANSIELTKNTVSLADHIRRTEILEEEIKLIKENAVNHEKDSHIGIMSKGAEFFLRLPSYVYILLKWGLGLSTAGAAVYSIIKLVLSNYIW